MVISEPVHRHKQVTGYIGLLGHCAMYVCYIALIALMLVMLLAVAGTVCFRVISSWGTFALSSVGFMWEKVLVGPLSHVWVQ